MRLIRRYVLAAVGIVLLLLFSGVAMLGWLGWQESCRLPQREYSSSEIADSMVETAEGLAFGAERTPQEWMNGYEWAMVLDDVGNIRWSYGLPQDLNHAYTPGDIAKFSRWYLADYPVFCWTEPYGLFVIGLPKGSLWKYSIYSSPDFALSMVRVLPAAALGMLMLGLVLCFWLSWRGAKRLETVANGLDALAQGQTVRLPTDGFAGELAEKLNQTGAQLQAKNEMLSRRDNARTQWIAGVSHDVRTPLALILGWAEQLEQDALLPDSSRQKAAGIRTQCEKLRTLIDDLNLTSKLEYGAQPLRRKDLRAGPLFRQLVAQFCESPLAERCEITLEQEEPAEQTVLSVDEALLARLLENLMNNSCLLYTSLLDTLPTAEQREKTAAFVRQFRADVSGTMIGISCRAITKVALVTPFVFNATLSVSYTHLADRKVGQYSLGMKQRLGIAMALLGLSLIHI